MLNHCTMEPIAKLSIACIQADLFWEEREKNLIHLENMMGNIREKVDMIVLPEMFSTGFTMEPEKFDEHSSQELSWMKQQAKRRNSVITGSYIQYDKGGYKNRLAFVTPESNIFFYDKRHLFRMGEEDKHYVSGDRLLELDRNGWRIKPFICYDLRFPVWIRSGSMPDVIVFVANWPAPRRDVWLTLLKARAIENQAYVIGVNRIGTDGRGIRYTGDTLVFDPKGVPVASSTSDQEEVVLATLDRSTLLGFREKFPVYLDADRFQIIS
jgi:omega-amidase